MYNYTLCYIFIKIDPMLYDGTFHLISNDVIIHNVDPEIK